MIRLTHLLTVGLILCTALTGTVRAQIITPSENLFDFSKRGQTHGTFTGKPFVYIGDTVGAPKPEKPSGWMDEEKKRLFGTTNITQSNLFPKGTDILGTPQPVLGDDTPIFKSITLRSTFGEERTDSYVPHTVDFTALIHIMDDHSITVNEYISYADPANHPFQRTIPLNKQTDSPEAFQLLSLTVDNKPVHPNVSFESGKVILSDPTYLPAGAHQIHLVYRLKNNILVNQNKAYFLHSLTGPDWPMPIERLNALISFAKHTVIFEKEMLFGKNKLKIENAAEILTDKTGQTVFKSNNLIPAYADVSVYASFHPAAVTSDRFEDVFAKHTKTFLAGFTAIIICLYLLISALWARFKKPEKNTIAFILKIAPLTLARLYQIIPADSLLEKLSHTDKISGKRLPLECKLRHHFLYKHGLNYILSCVRYLSLYRKYWATIILLLISVKMIYPIELTDRAVALFVTIAFIATALVIHAFIRPMMIKECWRYRQKIDQKNIFFGLSKNGVLPLFRKHYPYACVLKFDEELTDQTTQAQTKNSVQTK